MGGDRGVDASLPEFGNQQPGLIYRPRPGVYALIRDEQGRVAVIQVGAQFFLPGGGSEKGETPEATLRREIREECGRGAQIGQLVGRCVEYIRSQDGVGFRLECAFYEARFTGEQGESAEKDHELVWLSKSQAAEKLHRAGQSWAVNILQDRRT